MFAANGGGNAAIKSCPKLLRVFRYLPANRLALSQTGQEPPAKYAKGKGEHCDDTEDSKSNELISNAKRTWQSEYRAGG